MAAIASLKGVGLFLLRGGIGVIFVYAGITKLMDFAGFRESVLSYQILSGKTELLFSLTLPWLEIVCGLSLLTGVWVRGGTLLLMAAMGLFMVALGTAWWRGISLACGCFMEREPPVSGWLNLVRDMSMLGGLVLVWRGLSSTMARNS